MFCRFRSLFCVELCKNMNEMVEIIQKVSFSNGPEVFEIKMKQAGADYALKRPLFQSALYDLMKEICRKDRKERLL